MDTYLSKVYYDPGHKAGFGTLKKLYDAARGDNKRYTKAAIKTWLRTNDTYTLYKPQRKHFPTRKTMAYGIDDVHQADLADMSNYAKNNGGTTFLLCVIDVLSKKAWVRPLKNKSNESMVRAFRKLNDQHNTRIPASLGTDRGQEFRGKDVQSLLKSYGIHSYVLHNRQKAAVAERFVRTLKGKIHKYMDSNGSDKYVTRLQDFVDAYNNTKHRSIHMAPNKVTYANVTRVWDDLYADADDKKPAPKYSQEDQVRISEYKHVFSKGYHQNYTDEIFKIYKVLPTNPTTYKLKDVYDDPVTGTFYGYEMTPVVVPEDKAYRIEYVVQTRGRGKNKRWLYKYRGYPKPEWSSHPPGSLQR